MSEHHSHRTDEEWRAIIRNWHDKLIQRSYYETTGVIIEMEKEIK